MRRLHVLGCAAAIGLAALASTAAAHTTPARRSVVVQAEDDEVAVLVTWTAGTGLSSMLMFGQAQLGRRGHEQALEAARAVATKRALGPLTIELDGKPLDGATSKTKLTYEPGSRRPAVAILITAPIPPGAHTLSVDVPPNHSPRMVWTDRTVERRVTGSGERDSWRVGFYPLTLTWHPR